MKKNHIYIYNKQVSLVSSNAGEISIDSEIKSIITKSKLPNNLITKKLQLDKIKRNDLDLLSKKNIDNSINSMNKLNSKRTHLPDDLNNNYDKEEKNNDIDSIYNKSKKPEIVEDNIHKNISVRKGKIQKTINIFSTNKKNKNITIYPIDSMKENMIDKNNKRDKEHFHKKNMNDNFNLDNIYGSERELKEDEKTNKEKNEEEIEEERNQKLVKLYDMITGYNIEQKISYDNLKSFFFNEIPEDKTLITNINIRNSEFNNNNNNPNIKNINSQFNLNNSNNEDLIESIKTYDFDLEILRNHQKYYFGKVIRYFPYVIVKIYISDNFTRYNEISQQRVKESNFFCVGKIESNIVRNEFNIYKGNDKSTYEKILNITYNINLFGLFGVRVMTVNKYINNKLLTSYKNELPKWDNEYKFYKLNFNGRVKLICKKNFILKQKEENILQCGKIDDNSFALDFISPLSPFEAFCISITSLVNKKACE